MLNDISHIKEHIFPMKLEFRDKVLIGLEQVAEGKTKDFNEVWKTMKSRRSRVLQFLNSSELQRTSMVNLTSDIVEIYI